MSNIDSLTFDSYIGSSVVTKHGSHKEKNNLPQYQFPLSAWGRGDFQCQILKSGNQKKNECLGNFMSSCHRYLTGETSYGSCQKRLKYKIWI